MSAQTSRSPKQIALGTLGALGVVYGDIGTSPLYALRESFHVHGTLVEASHGAHVAVSHAAMLGILSLIVWSLILVVTVKYVAYVLRADNDGEGGILALLALALDPKRAIGKQRAIYFLGLFGAALLYGDGIITPAISVLSAIEGVVVEAPALEWAVIPITCTILIGLFAVQRFGTGRVGMLFGPITLAWFLILIAIAIPHLLRHPQILEALSPAHAVAYFVEHRLHGIVVLGAVFLVVTGGEALYADMGHFGAKPIRLAWIVVVLPALVIHYFGQGAYLIEHPEGIAHPVMHMSPEWARIPVLVVSTLATVIASQALISGVFSITRQAILLGFAPRLSIVHTSAAEIGQIYMPMVNWSLMVGTIALVVGFGSSTALGAAYGIAVTATMVITTLLAHVVARRRWRWPLAAALIVTTGFVLIDSAFLVANALKFLDGGWVPIVVAIALFVAFTTWHRGRGILADRIRERSIRFGDLAAWTRDNAPLTVPGTAVYLTAHPDSVPLSLVDNVRHNRALHARVILLSLVFEPHARVSVARRVRVERIDERVVRVFGHYGFVERPDVPKLLELALMEGIEVDVETVTFVLGRETLIATNRPGMARWRESLFAYMSRNAQRAAAFFGIPSERVLEVGAQIEL
jgi:KUP system potassium uptake protein